MPKAGDGIDYRTKAGREVKKQRDINEALKGGGNNYSVIDNRGGTGYNHDGNNNCPCTIL